MTNIDESRHAPRCHCAGCEKHVHLHAIPEGANLSFSSEGITGKEPERLQGINATKKLLLSQPMDKENCPSHYYYDASCLRNMTKKKIKTLNNNLQKNSFKFGVGWPARIFNK